MLKNRILLAILAAGVLGSCAVKQAETGAIHCLPGLAISVDESDDTGKEWITMRSTFRVSLDETNSLADEHGRKIRPAVTFPLEATAAIIRRNGEIRLTMQDGTYQEISGIIAWKSPESSGKEPKNLTFNMADIGNPLFAEDLHFDIQHRGKVAYLRFRDLK